MSHINKVLDTGCGNCALAKSIRIKFPDILINACHTFGLFGKLAWELDRLTDKNKYIKNNISAYFQIVMLY